MKTNIKKIKKLAKRKEDENWRFRSFLKGCDEERIDSIVHRLYREVSSKIDCKACANCCKEALPILDQEDMDKLSSGMGISTTRLKEQYLVKADEPTGYTFSKTPCPFLKDNACLHHAHRPENCVSYPHLHKEGFMFRLINVVGNCSVCPIVFNVYEGLKREVWHR